MIVVASIFIVLGILIKYGKMYFLIAGYNTMSKAEQEKVDIKSVATIFRNGFFGMALIILFGYLFDQKVENANIDIITFLIALLLGIPYLIINANSKKHKL